MKKLIFKKILGHGIACLSAIRGVVLNILGAGGVLALGAIIETYEKRDLHHILFPIYFSLLGLLSLWQLLIWTLFSSEAYRQHRHTESDNSHSHSIKHEITIANNYPVLYLFNDYRYILANTGQKLFNQCYHTKRFETSLKI